MSKQTAPYPAGTLIRAKWNFQGYHNAVAAEPADDTPPGMCHVIWSDGGTVSDVPFSHCKLRRKSKAPPRRKVAPPSAAAPLPKPPTVPVAKRPRAVAALREQAPGLPADKRSRRQSTVDPNESSAMIAPYPAGTLIRAKWNFQGYHNAVAAEPADDTPPGMCHVIWSDGGTVSDVPFSHCKLRRKSKAPAEYENSYVGAGATAGDAAAAPSAVVSSQSRAPSVSVRTT